MSVLVPVDPAGMTTPNGFPANGFPANGFPANGFPANGFPANGSLDDIPENSTEPYMSDLTSRMEQMKMDRQKLADEKARAEQEGGATPPPV